MLLASNNPKIKLFRSLKQKKARDKEDKFIIEGVKLIQEAAESDYEIEFVLAGESFLYTKKGKLFSQNKYKIYQVEESALKKLSETETPQGILAVVKKREFGLEDVLRSEKTLLVCDRVQDPGNLGTILRSADAFGIGGLLFSKDTVEAYNPKVVRASMGSIFHVKFIEKVDLKKALVQMKKDGYRVFSSSSKEGEAVGEVKYSLKSALIVGNESQGVSPEIEKLADGKIMVPISSAESLNVSASCAIMLYEMTKCWKR